MRPPPPRCATSTAHLSCQPPTNPPANAPGVCVAPAGHPPPPPIRPPAQAVPPGTRFLRIPRSREVGQSYASAVVSTARAAAASVLLVLRERPALVLVNGPGTCLPVAVAAKVLSCLRLVPACRVVFVESVCRTVGLSLTGRLLYHSRLADQVQVQWPSLAKRCARAGGGRGRRGDRVGRSTRTLGTRRRVVLGVHWRRSTRCTGDRAALAATAGRTARGRTGLLLRLRGVRCGPPNDTATSVSDHADTHAQYTWACSCDARC